MPILHTVSGRTSILGTVVLRFTPSRPSSMQKYHEHEFPSNRPLMILINTLITSMCHKNFDLCLLLLPNFTLFRLYFGILESFYTAHRVQSFLIDTFLNQNSTLRTARRKRMNNGWRSAATLWSCQAKYEFFSESLTPFDFLLLVSFPCNYHLLVFFPAIVTDSVTFEFSVCTSFFSAHSALF